MDRDASSELIKLAYRRLARENHPDLVQHLGPEAMAHSSALMSAINEAYTVLSHSRRRREYDASSLGGNSTAVVTVEDVAVAEPVPVTPRGRTRPTNEVLSSVVNVFSQQLRSTLTSKAGEFKWHEKQVEGFNWMLSTSTWNANYYVGLRGFAFADMDSAAKFTNYCDLAIARSRAVLKRNYFLFFFPFQKCSSADSVAASLRRFCANQEGQRTPGPVRIIMMDVASGRALVCGPRVSDDRYHRLVTRLVGEGPR